MVHPQGYEPLARKAAARVGVAYANGTQNLNMNVILVRDVVSLVALFAVTIVVIWQFLHALFVAD